MHAPRLFAILFGCLLAALAGCCAVPCSDQSDWPFAMRPYGGHCCEECGPDVAPPPANRTCGTTDAAPIGDDCGFRPGIVPALAGLLTFEEPGPAVPPPHDPWFVAVPTCPVLPVAHAPPVGPPAMMPIQPGPVYEPVPPPAEQPPAQEQQAPSEQGPPHSNAPMGRDAIQHPGAPALLHEYRPGVGWVFRPANNDTLDNVQRGVRRAPSESASKPRSTGRAL